LARYALAYLTMLREIPVKKNRPWIAAVFVMLVSSLAATSAHESYPRSSGEVIIEWNAILQKYSAGQPFTQVRGYAMMHVAMADAVIAIDGKYEPFQTRVRAPYYASAEAAAAQAGHDVFYALIVSPEGRTAADAALAAQLAKIYPGARQAGIYVGQKVAADVIAAHANDGYATANPQPPLLGASTLPGIWQPTASGPMQFSDILHVQPFGLLTTTQFMPTPVPQLESTAYAEAFNEVKHMGGAIAPDRTEAQTRFAQLFAASPGTAYVNATSPFRLWSNVVRDLSRQKRMSLVGTARMFALTMVSMNDSLVTSHSSKMVYKLWRPETAIAHADIDNNPATEADASWKPLVTTPPYPAYASNMTCLGTGGARMLADLLGSDAQAFSATWYTATDTPVWTETYTSLWQLGDDEANSRIWGGIHYRFDIDAAQVSCVQVADYIFDNYMRRTRY
jgi:hypothetical protein